MARRDTFASPSLVLFLALFASQAGVLVLSPILSEVAEDFGVSIAAAGLRIFAAPLAAVVAPRRPSADPRSPRRLGAGALLAVGSVASAAAPTFCAPGASAPRAGIATLLAAGVAGAAAWSSARAPDARRRARARRAARRGSRGCR